MNEQDTLKQYEATNKRHIFLTKNGVEIINLPKILQPKTVLFKMPSDIPKDDTPMAPYKLQQPIRFKLFNHKKFVGHFEIKSFIQNKTLLNVTVKITIYRF